MFQSFLDQLMVGLNSILFAHWLIQFGHEKALSRQQLLRASVHQYSITFWVNIAHSIINVKFWRLTSLKV